MTRAEPSDLDTVVEILVDAFSSDPYVNWLLEKSRDPLKLRHLIDYVVDEAYWRGEIWLAGDGAAAALWHPSEAERFSWRFLLRNTAFLSRIGLVATLRTLSMEHAVHALIPGAEPYHHLYLIGVRSGSRGQGLASALIDPMIRRLDEENSRIVLETANSTNVLIYQKKGFEIVGTVARRGITVYVMERRPAA